MSDEIRRLPGITSEEVGTAPEIELSTFGMQALAERLEPSSGKRPGRPTDPSWEKTGKLPMSEETANTLRRLAGNFSTPRRRISPMQVAAYLLADEVQTYRDVFDFLDQTEPKLRTIWDNDETSRDQRLHANEREWAIIEFKEGTIEQPLLWKASQEACLTTSILHAGILREYGHVVIRGDLLGSQKKEELKRFAECHPGLAFWPNMQAFQDSRPAKFSPDPVLLTHFRDRRIHRFRYPLRVVHEPYLHHLANRFEVTFNVVHATVIGSHGYLDVELTPFDRADKLLDFARHLGIDVRWVHRNSFWDDLSLDCEEEIRRSLVTVRGRGEDWQSLPPESDSVVAKILERFIAQYELFPGHYTLGDWLFREADTSENVQAPSTVTAPTPLQEALSRATAKLVNKAGSTDKQLWDALRTMLPVTPLQEALLLKTERIVDKAGGKDNMSWVTLEDEVDKAA